MTLSRPDAGQTPRRLTSLVAIAATAALALTACASTDGADEQSATPASDATVLDEARALLPDDVVERGKLRMTSDFQYAPFTFLDGEEFAGMDYELGNHIAASLGLEPEWSQETSFGAIVPSVQNGRVDAALDSINVNPERLEAVSFVTYISTYDVLLTPAGNPGDLDPANLCGASLSMATGGATNPLLAEYSEDCEEHGEEPIELNEYSTSDAQFLAVQNGRVDGVSVGSAPAMMRAEASNGTLEVQGPVTVLDTGELMRAATAGVVVAKEDTALADAILLVIEDMQADGSFLELLEKWGFDETAVAEAEFVE